MVTQKVQITSLMPKKVVQSTETKKSKPKSTENKKTKLLMSDFLDIEKNTSCHSCDRQFPPHKVWRPHYRGMTFKTDCSCGSTSYLKKSQLRSDNSPSPVRVTSPKDTSNQIKFNCDCGCGKSFRCMRSIQKHRKIVVPDVVSADGSSSTKRKLDGAVGKDVPAKKSKIQGKHLKKQTKLNMDHSDGEDSNHGFSLIEEGSICIIMNLSKPLPSAFERDLNMEYFMEQ